ncbi:hypothetical protein RND81_10G071400 [Saponaria officinalis]|uniref:Auxin-responsive protein n=1 Tax=Saponaria officinalis TaxID=3572 RepID=A0AAW1HYK7_SAPOF
MAKEELSLGLPGCESPEKKHGVTIFGKEFEEKSETLFKGSKRGFSDAIDGCEKWVLSINGGSQGNFEKDEDLGENYVKNGHNLGVASSCIKPCVQEKEQLSGGAPAAKSQVVGWPPIRSFRKNTMASTPAKSRGKTDEKSVSECLYVKVSMDGAPYLRKVDLQVYKNYMELSSALEKMFNCSINGQYRCHGHAKRDVLTYEDKDGDWMLVGDVPWKMFTENCRKLRIMKGSEAIGLAPNAAEKGKIQA